MAEKKSYHYAGPEDLRSLMSEGQGPSNTNKNVVRLGRFGDGWTDIYHAYHATVIVGPTDISLTAVSQEEIEKAKNGLEKMLNIQLK